MKRVLFTTPMAFWLILAVASPATSQPDPSTLRKHSYGPDGVWNRIYAFETTTYPGQDPTQVIFDPTRRELVRFTHEGVAFESIEPPGHRYVRTRDWPGIPIESAAIYDPRRDRIVAYCAERMLEHVGVFALSLREPVRWDRLVPYGTSPNLGYASAINDPVGDRMIVYGGADLAKSLDALGELWSLSLGDRPRWT